MEVVMILIYKKTKYYSDSNGYWMRQYVGPEGKIVQKYLHREVWEEHYGPIPPRYIVHHKDGDKSNYNIENLEMMEKGTHIRLHRRDAGEAQRIKKLKESWKKRPEKKYTCCHCGDEFYTKSRRARHCSIDCWRDRRASLIKRESVQLVLSF
jgi:hypothetical protein